MTARLRELVERWKRNTAGETEIVACALNEAADELLSILDADERPRFARSDGVSDADVEAAAEALFDAGWDSPADNSLDALRAALTHFAKGSEVGGDAEDAARYRWLREHVQPYRNGNPSPHAIVKVSLGIGADQRERSFDLIDKVAHVGVVTLDQAIDAARKGERHE